MTIAFAPSARSSLGIEWELALIDAQTGELRNVATQMLNRLGSDARGDHPFITGELLENTVELRTDVHRTVTDAVADLRARLSTLHQATEPQGLAVVGGGSHPFASWHEQQVADTERYRRLIERTQWWGRNMMIWGVHVHVGVEDVRKVFPLLHALVAVSPQVQALAASSPFWAGEATGYASNRALIFQQLPTAGLPFDLNDWAEFESTVDEMIRAGIIDEVSELRWDVRPAPRWGTVEFRVCDGPATLDEVATIAAYVHCLTDWFSSRLDAGETLPHLKPWFARENKWRAARYGLDATVIVDNAGGEAPLREQIAQTIDALEPIAARLRCTTELAGAAGILQHGAGYQRQLAEFERSHDLRAVTALLSRELRTGLA